MCRARIAWACGIWSGYLKISNVWDYVPTKVGPICPDGAGWENPDRSGLTCPSEMLPILGRVGFSRDGRVNRSSFSDEQIIGILKE